MEDWAASGSSRRERKANRRDEDDRGCLMVGMVGQGGESWDGQLEVGWIDVVGSISEFPPMRWRAIHSELSWVFQGYLSPNATPCMYRAGAVEVDRTRDLGEWDVRGGVGEVRSRKDTVASSGGGGGTVELESVLAGPTDADGTDRDVLRY